MCIRDSGSAYETKYTLIENEDGYDYLSESSSNLNENGTYNTGDILNPSYWASGYFAGHYNSGKKDQNKDDGAVYTGIFKVSDLLTRIIDDTPESYFHYVFGTESWGNWEEEITFGKVKGMSSGRLTVAYGESTDAAINCAVSGKRVTKYDCETGYISLVDASEISEGDWAFVQQSNKDFKMVMFFTNVESASLDNIKSGTNKRK